MQVSEWGAAQRFFSRPLVDEVDYLRSFTNCGIRPDSHSIKLVVLIRNGHA